MLTPRASTSWSWGVLSVVAGIVVGVAAAWVGAWALLGGVALAGVALAARFPMRSEWTVAAFWVAYTAYETVFSTVTIEGFFYAFYLLLGAGVVVGLAGEGLRLPAPYLWLQVSFLFVVLLSFVGFADPIGFDVLVRVIAYLFLPLTLAQVRSPAGVSLVRRAAVVAAGIIAVWVVASAIEGDFGYRGNVDVDQNVVAFYIALGVAVLLGRLFAGAAEGRVTWVWYGSALATGVLLYAQLLLASRGVTIALAVMLVALAVRASMLRARALLVVVGVALLVGAALLLPGGQNVVERFEGERVESAGSRTPIWAAAWNGYADGDVRQLLVGQGFNSSRVHVQRHLGTVTSTHNAYLQVLFEFGIVGLLLFLGLHVWVAIGAWRAGLQGLPSFALLALLMGSNLSLNTPDGFMFWTAIGLAASASVWPEARPSVSGGGS